MKPHQERVVAERDELAHKIERLGAFLNGDTFGTLAVEEKDRMRDQYGLMQKYHDVLNARIAAFS